MAGQEHITLQPSARQQPYALTVEQSTKRIELFDSFSEHQQQQQRQKPQVQQHKQKPSDAVNIRATMAEQEIKKSGAADMGRMLLEADSHIVRLTAQLEERSRELAAAREQLLMAAHWLQKAADQLDDGKVAATAQQERYNNLLQRHQTVLQQLELLADRGAGALELLTAAVPDSLQATQLTTDCMSGVYLAMDVLKQLTTLQPNDCQSPCSTLPSIQTTPRGCRSSSPQSTPRHYGHSSPRPYSYSRLSTAQPSPRTTAPTSCADTPFKPRLPSLATATAAKLMHRAWNEGQQIPEAPQVVPHTAEDDMNQLQLSPRLCCGSVGSAVASKCTLQKITQLQGRPIVPPLATAVAAAVAAAELAAEEAAQSACATNNSSTASGSMPGICSTPGMCMPVQPLLHSSSLGTLEATAENSALTPRGTPGCTGADSNMDSNSSPCQLRRRQVNKAKGSFAWRLVSKRDRSTSTLPVTGTTSSGGDNRLLTAAAAVMIVVMFALWLTQAAVSWE